MLKFDQGQDKRPFWEFPKRTNTLLNSIKNRFIGPHKTHIYFNH